MLERARPIFVVAVLLVAVCSAVSGAFAARPNQTVKPSLQGKALVTALAQGGYTILFRHTSTVPVKPDPSLFDPDDCSTQRNLSDEGRREAEEIGAAFQKLGIQVDKVLSSPYCRCMDTAALAFGDEQVETSTVLLVGATRPGTGRNDPGVAIRSLLDTPPAQGTNTVLIAHSVTLLYAFGLEAKPEGIAHVFRPTGMDLGRPDYVGTLTPDEWSEYADSTDAASDAAPDAPETPAATTDP